MQVGFFGLLTIVFIVLKVTEMVAWSWWIVFSPLAVAAVVTILAIVLLAILGQRG